MLWSSTNLSLPKSAFWCRTDNKKRHCHEHVSAHINLSAWRTRRSECRFILSNTYCNYSEVAEYLLTTMISRRLRQNYSQIYHAFFPPKSKDVLVTPEAICKMKGTAWICEIQKYDHKFEPKSVAGHFWNDQLALSAAVRLLRHAGTSACAWKSNNSTCLNMRSRVGLKRNAAWGIQRDISHKRCIVKTAMSRFKKKERDSSSHAMWPRFYFWEGATFSKILCVESKCCLEGCSGSATLPDKRNLYQIYLRARPCLWLVQNDDDGGDDAGFSSPENMWKLEDVSVNFLVNLHDHKTYTKWLEKIVWFHARRLERPLSSTRLEYLKRSTPIKNNRCCPAPC